MSKLKELRERVEKASGPDREIDYAIAGALLDATKEPNYWFWQSGREQGAPLRPVNAYWTDRRTPRFTTSIDAALALVEQVLPGAEYEITTLYCVAHVTLFVDAALPGRREDGHVPLAIVTALLRTVEAKGGHDG